MSRDYRAGSPRRPLGPLLMWLAAVVVGVLSGCAGPPPSEPAPPAGLDVVVAAEPGATTTAVALVVPGSAWEEAGTSGLTLLAARAVLEDAGPELAALGARANVTCGRWAFVVTVVAPEDSWRGASEVLTRWLRAGDPSPAAVDRARRGLASSLALDVANPAWQARLAAMRALYAPAGGESAWARPACGVVEALPLFDRALIGGAVTRLEEVAGAAVVGAVDSTTGPWLERLVGPVTRVAGRPAHGVVPTPPSPGRVYVERNTVTAWLSVAWPFGRGTDPEAVRLVGALLEDAVGPALSRPDVLHAESEVLLHGDGGALIVTVVVTPDRAPEMAAALEAGVAELAAGAAHPAVVERVARRQRGIRLRELSAPEARAARLAVEGARGRSPAPWPSPESFTGAAAASAAGALGAPARAVVGPRAARGAVVP